MFCVLLGTPLFRERRTKMAFLCLFGVPLTAQETLQACAARQESGEKHASMGKLFESAKAQVDNG